METEEILDILKESFERTYYVYGGEKNITSKEILDFFNADFEASLELALNNCKTLKAYKLFKKRKNGTLGSLFINARAVLDLDVWMEAKPHRKKGFAFRPGWHCTFAPFAPHLTKNNNRVWGEVEVEDYTIFKRPETQGGLWILAKKMKIVKELTEEDVRKINEKTK
jgi:hypothetical protein